MLGKMAGRYVWKLTYNLGWFEVDDKCDMIKGNKSDVHNIDFELQT